MTRLIGNPRLTHPAVTNDNVVCLSPRLWRRGMVPDESMSLSKTNNGFSRKGLWLEYTSIRQFPLSIQSAETENWPPVRRFVSTIQLVWALKSPATSVKRTMWSNRDNFPVELTFSIREAPVSRSTQIWRTNNASNTCYSHAQKNSSELHKKDYWQESSLGMHAWTASSQGSKPDHRTRDEGSKRTSQYLA